MTPRRSQLMAAAALIDNRMAEMATGEGKTLAIGLAAAVAALAGIPVHVVTANSYLAQRDAQRLAPFYARLGLDVAAIGGSDDDAARRAVYRHAVVYATAKDLAFDFLRDRQASASAHPLEQVAGVDRRPRCRTAAAARSVHGAARRGRQHPARRGRGAADPVAQRSAQRAPRLHVAGAGTGAPARCRA